MNNFNLDSRLEDASAWIGRLDLCQLRLHKNIKFPWILLIPEKENLIELTDLTPSDLQILMSEMTLVTKILQDLFQPDKMNVATLGNIVPQLHMHIIARYKTDEAWPNPVWNSGIEKMGTESELEDLIHAIRAEMSNKDIHLSH